MDREQFYNTIINTPGVKQSELDDIGFKDFVIKSEYGRELIDQPKITKEEIDAFSTLE